MKRRANGTVGKTKTGAKRMRFDMNGVARFAAIGMAAIMATGIMVNALVLQKGHHPAPLFGKSAAASSAAPIAQAALKAPPAPPSAKAQRVEVASEPPTPPVKPRNTVVASHDTDALGAGDAIGQLLAGGAPAASAKIATDGKTVSGVQRALTKLGFKVPATGSIGPATKRAIEAFEKDRHLPVKGEVNRRLVKVLATESGVKID